VRPRLELAHSAELDTDRGILSNEYLQTSDPDIFTAGDCAQVFDLQTKRSVVDSLWGPSRTQGRAAAMNMAGQKQVYLRKVDVNVLRLAGIMVSIIGSVGGGKDEDLVSVARGSSETWMQLPNSISTESGNEFNNLRLMVGERTLLGGLVLGDQKLSIPLQEMVEKQIDITPIRPKLMEAGPGLGQILMDYWTGTRE
jgi:NAD(P)H-nitrite reductase large subunit